MNIRDSDDIREIGQLWFAGLYYFECATKVKNDIKNDFLNYTVQEITDIYEKQNDPNYTGEKIPIEICKNIMLFTAHLGSCAVRISTIDELLGEKYQVKGRWKLYKKLDKNNTKYKIKKNLNQIIHFLLRHNIAHYEKKPLSNQRKNMQEVLIKLKINILYEKMEYIKKNMEFDISTTIQKYSIYKFDDNCC